MNDVLSVSGYSKSYDGRNVLDNISFVVPAGRIVGLLGPNGSGKTTIIKSVAGVMSGYTGTILVDGGPIGVHSKNVVSYLPDKSCLSAWMRVCDAVDVFNDFYSDFDKNKANELLGRLGIDIRAKVTRLSKGEYEKVQLVIVMSRAAKLYLLDEPLGGVDPASRDVIIDTILTNYSENSSVLLSTHLISDVERVFDSVVILKDRQILICDDVDAIREKYQKSVDELFREVFKCSVSC
jgi:ABC-2 type transport system ATP-binding protein